MVSCFTIFYNKPTISSKYIILSQSSIRYRQITGIFAPIHLFAHFVTHFPIYCSKFPEANRIENKNNRIAQFVVAILMTKYKKVKLGCIKNEIKCYFPVCFAHLVNNRFQDPWDFIFGSFNFILSHFAHQTTLLKKSEIIWG